MRGVLCPQALGPKDVVDVIAPSGPFDRTLFWRGVGWLSEHYRVRFSREAFQRRGFLAGDDERRTAELNRALAARDSKAIFCARGGHGALRIVQEAELARLLEHPKWLIGFSDFTLLHLEAQRLGLASIHAHNVTGLGRGDQRTRQQLLDILGDPTRRRQFEGLGCWVRGTAQGPLVGGNLSLLVAAAAAQRLHLPASSILLLEEVAEAPYRLDRMLTALRLGGAFDRVAGVVIGELTDCHPGRHGVSAGDVVRDQMSRLNVPVAADLPVGHGARNHPIVLGLEATLDAGRGLLSVGG